MGCTYYLMSIELYCAADTGMIMFDVRRQNIPFHRWDVEAVVLSESEKGRICLYLNKRQRRDNITNCGYDDGARWLPFVGSKQRLAY